MGRRRNPPRYPYGESPQLLTGVGEMREANIKIELWYLDLMHLIAGEVTNSIKLDRLPHDKAMKVAIDAILSTIKYGIVIERD